MKMIKKYGLFLLLLTLMCSCSLWDDQWDEVNRLPSTDSQVDVKPWDTEEGDEELF